MKIKVIKPIKITEVGKTVLPLDFETEISQGAGEIFVKRGFVIEIEGSKKVTKTRTEDKAPHWKEVVASVKEAETLEDLVQFESDERASVIKAVEEKRLELEVI